jgi:hypothetical protein
LLLALATLLAGFFVVIGAIVAWRSVQRQIRSAERIERSRRNLEISTIEVGFTADLIVYSRSVIEATSIWNRRALQSPKELVRTQWPVMRCQIPRSPRRVMTGDLDSPFGKGHSARGALWLRAANTRNGSADFRIYGAEAHSCSEPIGFWLFVGPLGQARPKDHTKSRGIHALDGKSGGNPTGGVANAAKMLMPSVPLFSTDEIA